MSTRDEAIKAGVEAVIRAVDDHEVSGDEEFASIVIDAADPIIRADEAKVRELIAEQVTTLAPDESGRISKGLALAYILGELDATIAREDCTDGAQVKEK